MGAMSIQRTTQDSARIAGALTGAGLVATLGMGPAYAVVASLYAIERPADAESRRRALRPSSGRRHGSRARARFAVARSQGRARLCLEHAAICAQ